MGGSVVCLRTVALVGMPGVVHPGPSPHGTSSTPRHDRPTQRYTRHDIMPSASATCFFIFGMCPCARPVLLCPCVPVSLCPCVPVFLCVPACLCAFLRKRPAKPAAISRPRHRRPRHATARAQNVSPHSHHPRATFFSSLHVHATVYILRSSPCLGSQSPCPPI